MTRPDALMDALSCNVSTFYCITGDGGDVVPMPSELSDVGATHLEVESTMDHFDKASYGTIISAFLGAVTDGYGETTAKMDDGGAINIGIFERLDDLGCVVVCLTPTDSHVEVAPLPHLDLPTRRVTSRMTASGRTVSVDDGITRLLGWTVEEYIDTTSLAKTHPDDHQRAIRSFAELMGRPGGQARTRQRIRHRNGSWRWFEVTHTNNLHTDDPHVFAESFDISDEMHVTLELQEREELLGLLTDSLPVGVLHLSGAGQAELTNKSWSDLAGTSPTDDFEVFLERVDNDEEVRELIESARHDGQAESIAVTFSCDLAACRHADLVIQPLSSDDPPYSLLLTLTDTSESVAAHDALHRQTRHDHLTGVLNRRGLEEGITALLDDRRSTNVTVLYCDLDDFKGINDTLGHATGDEVLEAVTDEMSRELRPDDLIGRWGGDEFLIVLVGLEPNDVTAVIDRIKQRLADRTDVLSNKTGISAAIGRADAEPDDDFETLLRRADAAMYVKKADRTQRTVTT